MMLGELLASAGRASAALPPALRDELARQPGGAEQAARQAVAAFERGASPDDWARLMGLLHGADDPGATCLETMVRWRYGPAGVPSQGDPR